MPFKPSLIGQTFGRWKILADAGTQTLPNGKKRRIVFCECECGTKAIKVLSRVLSGLSGSCGCIRKETTASRNKASGIQKGDTNAALARLMSRVIKDASGCWLWTGPKSHGYGKMTIFGKNMSTHRLSWILHFGPIPKLHGGPHGTCVCHSCDVRHCVNPEHLWLGSIQDDMADKAQKGRVSKVGALVSAKLRSEKTHCVNGHSYLDGNLYLGPDGRRQCRICRKHADERRYAKYGNRRDITACANPVIEK